MKITLFVFMLVPCLAGLAQVGDSPGAFEAASIRPSDPDIRGGNITDTPGSLVMRSVSLRTCIEWAYEVQPFQITGPAWLGDSRFDISGRAASGADKARLRLMLRTLLADRFGIKLHHEPKELPVYSLVVTPGGPKFHDVGPKSQSRFLASTGEGPNHFGSDKTGLVAENVLMSEIGTELSGPLQRPVIDKTGLKGRYDLRIDVAAFMAAAGDGDNHPMDEMSVIFEAFPAQLGLKLEPGKDTVDFLVVDSANKVPTDN